MDKPLKISLIGMMGCGKSTLAKDLAEALQAPFIDLDAEIEKLENKEISTIFADSGEKYFRQLEEATALKILDSQQSFVLSTGGGSFLNDNIRNRLLQETITIWLHADAEVIFDRIRYNQNRPLLAEDNSAKKIQEIIDQRINCYSLAKYKIDTSKLNMAQVLEIAKIIINEIVNEKG